MTEITISSPKDKTLQLPQSEMIAFDLVDKESKRSIQSGSPEPLMILIENLIGSAHLRGLAAAKAFCRMRQNWDEYKMGTSFANFVDEQTSFSSQTAMKYSSMWAAVFDNPEVDEEIRNRLLMQPIRRLLLLSAAAKEGQLEGYWEELSFATTDADFREIIREVRGEQTSANSAINIMYNTSDGSLFAGQGDDPYEPIGYLVLERESSVVAKAVGRILRAAGIQEVHND